MYQAYNKARYSDIKLTYFNLRGRCEGVRYVLAAAEVPYEDIRIKGDDWKDLKPKTPFGSLPMLEVNGYKLGESAAIARFVARIGGLYGSTPEEQAIIDAVVDVSTDYREGVVKAFLTKGEDEQKAALNTFCNETAQSILKNLEALLESHGQNYFVGGKLSLADIWFMASLDMVIDNGTFPDTLKPFPKLEALYKKVRENPGIVEYMKKRPETHH